MINQIKYRKYGNLDLFKKKKALGVYSTRNDTYYSREVLKKIILKFKNEFVFYFTYDFYLRSGLYKFNEVNYRKILITEEKYLHHNLIKSTEAYIIVDEFSENKRLNYLFKDLVILNFVKKILILEATKFSYNLKILAEMASENSLDVFCLPGKITDFSSYGSNKIIYDGGIPLFDFDLLNS